jgi:hypothetical protein
MPILKSSPKIRNIPINVLVWAAARDNDGEKVEGQIEV